MRFGADGAEYELRLGADTPVGANVYARTGEAGIVYTVASHQARAFEVALLDLREKRILDFDAANVAHVEASWPGGRVVLEREAPARPKESAEGEAEPEADAEPAEAAWRLSSPLETRADADAVDRLLSNLSFLRADAFADQPSAEQLELLDPPDFEATLQASDPDALPLQVTVSRADAEEHRWVRADGELLYRIPAERIQDFPRRTVAYRERLLARFTPLDAQQVDFFFQPAAGAGGDPLVINAERGSAGWTSSPEAFAAGKLSDVVAELARLTADDIVAESMGPKELEALGLAPPAAVITVLGARPASGEGSQPDAPLPRLAEVHFGRATHEGVVARVAGAAEV